MEKSKKKLANTMLYYVVGLCIIAIIAVTFLTTASKKENVPAAENSSESLTTSDRGAGSVIASESTKNSEIASEKRTEKASVNDKSAAGSASDSKNTTSADSESGGTKTALTEEKQTYSCPVDGYVSKEYQIDVPVYSVTMNDYRAHTGIDILCDEGNAVSASADGVVKNVINDQMMGTTVAIEHADGVCTYYMNLNETLPADITVGAVVEKGQLIGAVGSSALVEVAQEPHLHFEMTVSGAYVDPMTMLDMTTVSVMSDNVIE